MPDFWLDADSLINPSRGPFRFSTSPRFWEFLEQKAREGIIASPEMVFQELAGNGDPLEEWAKMQRGHFFKTPDENVQEVLSRVANYVGANSRYEPQHIARFLAGADPWVIAHPLALGGRIVTFERPEPTSKRPKIPDVAAHFGLQCIELWDLLSELDWRIG